MKSASSARPLAFAQVAEAGDQLEEVLAVLGAVEDERAGLEDRDFYGAFGEGGVVAETHH